MCIFAFKAAAFFYQVSDRCPDAYFNNLGVFQCLAGKEQIRCQHRLVLLHRQRSRSVGHDSIFFCRACMGSSCGIGLRDSNMCKVSVGDNGSDRIKKGTLFLFRACFYNDFCGAHRMSDNVDSFCDFADKPAG